MKNLLKQFKPPALSAISTAESRLIRRTSERQNSINRETV